MKLSAIRAVQFSWDGLDVPKLSHPLAYLRFCQQVYRQRQQLLRLTDEHLADIGISRLQAEAEAAKSFWDVPRQKR